MIKHNSLYCFAGIILLLCLGGEPEIVFNHFKIFKDPVSKSDIPNELYSNGQKGAAELLNTLDQIRDKENIKLADTLIIADISLDIIGNVESYMIMNRDTTYIIEIWNKEKVTKFEKHPGGEIKLNSRFVNDMISRDTSDIYDIIKAEEYESGHILFCFTVIKKTSGTFVDLFFTDDFEAFK